MTTPADLVALAEDDLLQATKMAEGAMLPVQVRLEFARTEALLAIARKLTDE